MTLMEFLLARIAEDEWTARAASGIVSGPGQFGHDLWTFGDQRLEITKRRMIAECEAKRRVVEQCSTTLSGGHIQGALSDGDSGPWLADRTMRLLSLPYANHSDYDESWRT